MRMPKSKAPQEGHGLIPVGFMRLSNAVKKLEEGMWGGLPRPTALVNTIEEIKKLRPRIGPTSSVGFGPWRAEAAERIRAAAIKGELSAYVVAGLKSVPKRVPKTIIPALVTSRGGLLDRPVRVSPTTVPAAAMNEELFALMNSGLLVVCSKEFDVWYGSVRRKGKWPSQKSKNVRREGRPSKQTGALAQKVLALAHEGKWNGNVSIARLCRLLMESGAEEIPSPDTVGRLVDRVFIETGDPLLRRAKKRQRPRVETG